MLTTNTFYILSKDYKKKKGKPKPKEETCIECGMNPVAIFCGDWKGWCETCKEIDIGLDRWQMACWEEESKPQKQQNVAVFMGWVETKETGTWDEENVPVQFSCERDLLIGYNEMINKQKC